MNWAQYGASCNCMSPHAGKGSLPLVYLLFPWAMSSLLNQPCSWFMHGLPGSRAPGKQPSALDSCISEQTMCNPACCCCTAYGLQSWVMSRAVGITEWMNAGQHVRDSSALEIQTHCGVGTALVLWRRLGTPRQASGWAESWATKSAATHLACLGPHACWCW